MHTWIKVKTMLVKGTTSSTVSLWEDPPQTALNCNAASFCRKFCIDWWYTKNFTKSNLVKHIHCLSSNEIWIQLVLHTSKLGHNWGASHLIHLITTDQQFALYIYVFEGDAYDKNNKKSLLNTQGFKMQNGHQFWLKKTSAIPNQLTCCSQQCIKLAKTNSFKLCICNRLGY